MTPRHLIAMAPRVAVAQSVVLPRFMEVFRFLETFEKSAADASEVSLITRAQIDGLLSMVSVQKIALPDATATLDLLQKGHRGISETDIDRLSSAVRGATASCGAVPEATKKNQAHLFLYNYLTRTDWDVLVNINLPSAVRISTIVDRSFSLACFTRAKGRWSHCYRLSR